MMKHEFKAVPGCLIFLKEREHIPFQTYILDVSCKKYVHTVTYSLCKNTKTNNLREKILSYAQCTLLRGYGVQSFA